MPPFGLKKRAVPVVSAERWSLPTLIAVPDLELAALVGETAGDAETQGLVLLEVRRRASLRNGGLA